jgi:uncharacterized membrane protein YgcG
MPPSEPVAVASPPAERRAGRGAALHALPPPAARLPRLLQRREASGDLLCTALSEAVRSACPWRDLGCLAERTAALRPPSRHDPPSPPLDKVGSSAWLDARACAVGTKCGRLLVIDAATASAAEALPALAPPPAARAAAVGASDASLHLAASPCGRRLLLEQGGNAALVSIRGLTLRDAPHGQQQQPPPPWWAASPARLFAAAWLSRDAVATGGRDGAVRVWRAPDLDADAPPAPEPPPPALLAEVALGGGGRWTVRGLARCCARGAPHVAAIANPGSLGPEVGRPPRLHLLDVGGGGVRPAASFDVPAALAAYALAADATGRLAAVADCPGRVTLFDVRTPCGAVLTTHTAPLAGWGEPLPWGLPLPDFLFSARSVSLGRGSGGGGGGGGGDFQCGGGGGGGSLLTVGTSTGRLVFIDARMAPHGRMEQLSVAPGSDGALRPRLLHGRAWSAGCPPPAPLRRGVHWLSSPAAPDDLGDSGALMAGGAVLTHAWSPDGRALFAGGGPLAAACAGCAAALWM